MSFESDRKQINSEFPEARIALCKCKEASGKAYGVRFQRKGTDWEYTWAFKIKESAAKREGYDKTEIVGQVYPNISYPGCPYCKKETFVVCEKCHKLNCNIITGELFTCDWCGNVGTLVDYKGEGIASGGDRG